MSTGGRLPVETYRGTPTLAAVYGVLRGRVLKDGFASFWLGTPTAGTPLIWPEGYHASDRPLTIHDAEGRVVGRAGEEVQLGGGFGRPEFRAAHLGCEPASAPWFAG